MSRWGGRFDADEGDPMAAMATLVDVMLVFACGLMAALVLGQRQVTNGDASAQGGDAVERGRKLQDVPTGVGAVGSGFESVGRVFRDPKSGKLILVESPSRGGEP